MISTPEVIRLLETPLSYKNDDLTGLFNVMVTKLNNRKYLRMNYTPTSLRNLLSKKTMIQGK